MCLGTGRNHANPLNSGLTWSFPSLLRGTNQAECRLAERIPANRPARWLRNQIGKHCLSSGFSELVRSVMLGLHFHRLFLNCYNSVVDYGV